MTMKRGEFLRRGFTAAAATAVGAPLAAEAPVVLPEWLSIHKVPEDNPTVMNRAAYVGEPGTHYLYWGRNPRRGIYNVPAQRVMEIVGRITANPDSPYEAIMAGIPRAIWANEADKFQGPGWTDESVRKVIIGGVEVQG